MQHTYLPTYLQWTAGLYLAGERCAAMQHSVVVKDGHRARDEPISHQVLVAAQHRHTLRRGPMLRRGSMLRRGPMQRKRHLQWRIEVRLSLSMLCSGLRPVRRAADGMGPR